MGASGERTPLALQPVLTVPTTFALPLSPETLTVLQAAEAAHEARLHEATQGLEAELRALEAASLSSEARHV